MKTFKQALETLKHPFVRMGLGNQWEEKQLEGPTNNEMAAWDAGFTAAIKFLESIK